MNQELLKILDAVKGLEDCMTWMKAVIHLDRRTTDLEEAMSKVVENLGKITNILEGI